MHSDSSDAHPEIYGGSNDQALLPQSVQHRVLCRQVLHPGRSRFARICATGTAPLRYGHLHSEPRNALSGEVSGALRARVSGSGAPRAPTTKPAGQRRLKAF